MTDGSSCSLVRLKEIEADSPTLIEGFPGIGLVASIAVDQITEQLKLDHCGNIVSEDFPPLTTFHDGRVRDMVRVYGAEDPPVMTLQADVALPPFSYKAMTECVHDQLAEDIGRAIFLAGAPAQAEEAIGDVTGIATDDALEADLREAGIELAEGTGLIGGITGALVHGCYRNDVAAAALIVRADPRMPDPAAAIAVIENALEPLVDFDIDTTLLKEHAQEIQAHKQQIADQVREMAQQQPGPTDASESMYR